MGKHAYLIMAHNQFELLKLLLGTLDDERNDIYLHIDKKVAQLPEVDGACRKSKIHLLSQRIHIRWGGASQIAAELALIRAATKQGIKYDYYHLISGVDLPIKSQDDIHAFFTVHQGKEFVSFEAPEFHSEDRAKYYWFFQEKIGNKKGIHGFFWKFLNMASLGLQKTTGVNRIQNKELQKGANWFSITDDLARNVANHSKDLLKQFKFTYCCDEVFLQSFLLNHGYMDKIYQQGYENRRNATMRYIVWEADPPPKVFTMEDFEGLKNTDLLFARKFDMVRHPEVVERVVRELSRT